MSSRKSNKDLIIEEYPFILSIEDGVRESSSLSVQVINLDLLDLFPYTNPWHFYNKGRSKSDPLLSGGMEIHYRRFRVIAEDGALIYTLEPNDNVEVKFELFNPRTWTDRRRNLPGERVGKVLDRLSMDHKKFFVLERRVSEYSSKTVLYKIPGSLTAGDHLTRLRPAI